MEYEELLGWLTTVAVDAGWDGDETIRSLMAVIHTAANENPPAIDLQYFLEAMAAMKDAESPPTSH
jgi:hypothetical protein